MKLLWNLCTKLELLGLFSKIHEQFCNLVSIHARSRHLDRPRPVEVVVAQVKSELLNRCLLHLRIIEGHIEMSRLHTSLSSELRDQIKIVLTLRILVLYDLLVNERAWWWILKIAIRIFYKESLCDSLVNNDDSDERLLLGRVVCLIDCLSELLNFFLENLTSHSIAYTISVDNEMFREILMTLTENTHGSLDCIFQVPVNDLLTFSLNDPLTVVLTPLGVNTSTETNNRIRTWVANIDSDQHSSLMKVLGELEIEEITTELRIYLPQNVACNWQIHASTKVLVANTLRDAVMSVADTLVLLVSILGKHHNNNSRFLLLLDQLTQAVLETRYVINSGQFNPRRLFYLKTKLSGRLQKGVENSVSTFIVLLLIDNSPSLIA